MGREHFIAERLPRAIIIYTHTVGTAVIRALGRMGVPVVAYHYSANESGYLSRYVTERIAVPDPRKNEAAFIQRIVDLGPRFKGSLLVPTDDYTLITLSTQKKLLSEHYVVAADDWPIVSQCINKQTTYALAATLGIRCPGGSVARSREEVCRGAKAIGFPCLLKPCQGHEFFDIFGAKMVKVADETELEQWYERISQHGVEVMVQEIVPGDAEQGVNYNSYFVDGQPLAEFTARKRRLEPPVFGSPRVIVSEAIPEVIEPGRVLLRGLKFTGFSCMEFKRDTRSGHYVLMEVNCRNNLSGSLAVECGVNFPWIQYNHLVFGKIVKAHDFRCGVTWIDETKDLMRLFASRKDECYSLREYIEPYLGPRTFAILDFRDPAPFLRRCRYVLGLAAGAAWRRLRTRGTAGNLLAA